MWLILDPCPAFPQLAPSLGIREKTVNGKNEEGFYLSKLAQDARKHLMAARSSVENFSVAASSLRSAWIRLQRQVGTQPRRPPIEKPLGTFGGRATLIGAGLWCLRLKLGLRPKGNG